MLNQMTIVVEHANNSQSYYLNCASALQLTARAYNNNVQPLEENQSTK